MDPVLTIDVGNSRIKWALWKHAAIVEQGAHDYSVATLAGILDAAWGQLDAPTSAMLACVAGAEPQARVQAWLAGRWQIEARILSTTQPIAGLSHGYSRPVDHGVDRWAAMIAARARYQTPLCVISCGTATTLDLIAGDGRHLGGLIMPGCELMLTALKTRIPALADIQLPAALPAELFATETAAAVALGVLQMAAAGVDRACDEAREKLGASMKTLITGGAATDMLALMKNAAELHPDLVLHGLYLAAQQGQA